MEDIKASRILIIDDEEMVYEMCKLFFEREGYRCLRYAADGQEGLRIAREWRPHLIISDLLHPGIGGLDLFRELFLDPNTLSTRFIILSGCRGDDPRCLAEKARSTGVSIYMTKPLDFREVVLRAGELLLEAREQHRRGL